MTTADLYVIETTEADDGTMHPAEQIWSGEDAKAYGFLEYGRVHITAFGGPTDDESVFPAVFMALGHQSWSAVIEAAAAYMDRVHGW
ncbi:hypothetical protein [Streptomyces sp. NPDC048357]|uniref:hypothetical protein n=1 Tax=Streptomyces sp. NPDC048357 TaxID=3154719 RepID=UPI00341BE7F0